MPFPEVTGLRNAALHLTHIVRVYLLKRNEEQNYSAIENL